MKSREEALEEIGIPIEELPELDPGQLLMLDAIRFANEDADVAFEPYGGEAVLDPFTREVLFSIFESGFHPAILAAGIRGSVAAGILLEKRRAEADIAAANLSDELAGL